MKYFNRFILLTLSIACFGSSSAQEFSIMTSDSVKLYVQVKGDGIPCLFVQMLFISSLILVSIWFYKSYSTTIFNPIRE